MQVDSMALLDAADNLANLGTAIEEGNALAAAPITGLLPAAADEISAAISQVFNGHGQWWQTIATEAQAFHQRFTEALASAASAFQETELAAEQALWDGVGALEQPLLPLFIQIEGAAPKIIPSIAIPSGGISSLLVGGSSFPLLNAQEVGQIVTLYINEQFPGAVSQAIFTPEQFWPFTPQLGNLTFGQSVAQGAALLNNAINTELSAGKNTVVWGISQSATVATVEIRNLMAAGSPYAHQLSFVLAGNPNTPDGGILERFVGGYIPGLDVSFNGATPPDAPYAVSIFTSQYDAVANFPQYILNPVADANALAGFVFLHAGAYAQPSFLSDAIQLPTSPGYTGNTQYFMTLTQNLPLAQPLRMLPQPYGNALADLLQPDLRVLSDLGYGSGEFANIPTPASFFELPNPFTIGPDLVNGAIQGSEAALVDLGFLPQSYYPLGSYPFSPVLDPGLNFPLPQSSVTGLSLLTGLEGSSLSWLGNATGLGSL